MAAPSRTVRPWFVPAVLAAVGLALAAWSVVWVTSGGEARGTYEVERPTSLGAPEVVEVDVALACAAVMSEADDEVTVADGEVEAPQRTYSDSEAAPCNRDRQRRTVWGVVLLVLSTGTFAAARAARRPRTRDVELAHGETLRGL